MGKTRQEHGPAAARRVAPPRRLSRRQGRRRARAGEVTRDRSALGRPQGGPPIPNDRPGGSRAGVSPPSPHRGGRRAPTRQPPPFEPPRHATWQSGSHLRTSHRDAPRGSWAAAGFERRALRNDARSFLSARLRRTLLRPRGPSTLLTARKEPDRAGKGVDVRSLGS